MKVDIIIVRLYLKKTLYVFDIVILRLFQIKHDLGRYNHRKIISQYMYIYCLLYIYTSNNIAQPRKAQHASINMSRY